MRLALALLGALAMSACAVATEGLGPEDANGPGADAGSADARPYIDAPVPTDARDARVSDAPSDTGAPDAAADCPLGTDGATGRCRRLVPSNAGDADELLAGATDLHTGSMPAQVRWVIDTDSGSITAYDGSDASTVVREAGVGDVGGIPYRQTGELGIFGFRSVVLGAGTTLVGVGTRALALLVAEDATIDGTLTVAANAERDGPGPGGASGGAPSGGAGSGPGGGEGGDDDGTGDGGGAGGSFGSSGGRGGKSVGGSPAAPYGTVELVPLVGGSGGGAGADPEAGAGGGGGGAIQLTAARAIRVGPAGVISAGGGAGRGGTDNDGGGGGGSGGAILLEAPVVAIDGRVGADGGGGGQGSTGSNGADGADGDPLSIPAAGSATSGSGGGGGTGSDADGVAGDGGDATNGGGGGGGAGRIRINTATGTETFDVTPSTASGLATVGAVDRAP